MPSRPETTRDDLGISQRFSDELLEALAAARALPDAHVLGAYDHEEEMVDVELVASQPASPVLQIDARG